MGPRVTDQYRFNNSLVRRVLDRLIFGPRTFTGFALAVAHGPVAAAVVAAAALAEISKVR